MTRRRRRRLRWWLPLIVAALLGVGLWAAGGDDGRQAHNPFAGRDLYVRPDSAAARAASQARGADAEVLDRLAAVPTALWLTPEAYGEGAVGRFVTEHARAADLSGRLLVLVVYGIPDRDCTGQESAGGLTADRYDDWVDEIADALAGDVAVIVEPDALAGAAECRDPAGRLALVRDAVARLADEASVYIDAGHSDWVPAPEMMRRLRAAGIDEARGFSTNVSAYQSDADELAYAEDLRAGLPEARYVVDSGRNGAGADEQWCNPPQRAIGVLPAAVEDDSALDARLWVKPPGESDGRCNGGPPAGEFWPDRAVDLAERAGW